MIKKSLLAYSLMFIILYLKYKSLQILFNFCIYLKFHIIQNFYNDLINRENLNPSSAKKYLKRLIIASNMHKKIS